MPLRRMKRLWRNAAQYNLAFGSLAFRSSGSISIGQRSYSTKIHTVDDVAIIGGGITGLTSAFFLSKLLPRTKITIYEAGKYMGGWVSTKRVQVPNGEVLFEEGPRTLRPQTASIARLKEIIQELNLNDELLFTPNNAPAARNRYVYYPDHLVRVPMGDGPLSLIWTILSEPLFRQTIPGILREPIREPRSKNIDDESLGSFVCRRINKAAADNALSAMMHGIYAGDIYQLSAKEIGSLQWHLEGKYGSVARGVMDLQPGERFIFEHDRVIQDEYTKFRNEPDELSAKLRSCSVFTFKNGLQQLTDSLVDYLGKNRNIQLKTSSRVSNIQIANDGRSIKIASENDSVGYYDYAISTIFSKSLSGLCCSQTDSPLVPSLKMTNAVTVMVVNLYFTNPSLLPVHGFGYLIPQSVPFAQNPERALGVIFDSDVVSGQDTAPGTKITVMLGGHWWDEWLDFPSKEEGILMARTILARHLNITEEPAATNVAFQKSCIPQYKVGHEEMMKSVHSQLKTAYGGRLQVVGSSYTGVGILDCVRWAKEIALGLQETAEGGWAKTGLEVFVEGRKLIKVGPPQE